MASSGRHSRSEAHLLGRTGVQPAPAEVSPDFCCDALGERFNPYWFAGVPATQHGLAGAGNSRICLAVSLHGCVPVSDGPMGEVKRSHPICLDSWKNL